MGLASERTGKDKLARPYPKKAELTRRLGATKTAFVCNVETGSGSEHLRRDVFSVDTVSRSEPCSNKRTVFVVQRDGNAIQLVGPVKVVGWIRDRLTNRPAACTGKSTRR